MQSGGPLHNRIAQRAVSYSDVGAVAGQRAGRNVGEMIEDGRLAKFGAQAAAGVMSNEKTSCCGYWAQRI